MAQEEMIWEVSDVNRNVRDIIEGTFLPFWIRGEVGSLTLHRAGHAYLTLKDKSSQLRAVGFNCVKKCQELGVVNGTTIEAFGNLTVYEPRGEYQFSIRQMRIAGMGSLQQRFEETKRKLAAEGLFDPARKRPIPALPRRIGVITSPDGAAIRDFLQIITRRFPNVNVRIYPAAVQGEKAAAQVAKGVEFFNRTGGADVLVITRGGGSMEDLWPFNEEFLARAVAASEIPVISAIGHEIDFSICDFAADLRAPTPSAAAELVIGRQEELKAQLERYSKDLRYMLNDALGELKRRLERAAGSFVFHEPRHMVEMRTQQIDEFETRMQSSAERFILCFRGELDRLNGTLQALNPQRQLERGYAILQDPENGGAVISSREQPPGKRLSARVADGTFSVTVEK